MTTKKKREEQEDVVAPPRFYDQNYSPESTRSLGDDPPKNTRDAPPDTGGDSTLRCNDWMKPGFDPDESNRSEPDPVQQKANPASDDKKNFRGKLRTGSKSDSIRPPKWLNEDAGGFAATERNPGTPIDDPGCLARFCRLFR
eukprot:CAMPEP_0194283948 /NCGR_PEP_ID=MMETSP0169-20130528/26512_1 /TAXON_ID=218684 /ORGANISM="Corethron pennatum, Strain L29A3" /LENGTH=141 /DNA_ID=CAMNT_0039029659 /DNA_START=68 /DNA_END=493 /DNA_ORIENTATION=-